MKSGHRPHCVRVLLVVEGFADIRYLLGINEVCNLTVVVPARQYLESGLKGRLEDSGQMVDVHEIPGGRLRYQFTSFLQVWKMAKDRDVILAQEVLRGALSCCIVGALRRKPVVTTMHLPPVEYYRCRYERRQIGWFKARVGEIAISALAHVNGWLAKRCVALGPYLNEVASRYSSRVSMGRYYGVDTDLYQPVDRHAQLELRGKLNLPIEKFLIFVASRVSHEKDAETVLSATSLIRARGLDAAVINLGGGHREFIELGKQLLLPDADQWVLGRPAAHPMHELAQYFQAADVLVQSSLEEGAGMAPLESLACGTPAVCTAVGGLARILPGYAMLTPRRDPEAMAAALQWTAEHRKEAREIALRGREMVVREWGHIDAFRELAAVLEQASHGIGRQAATS